MSASRPLGSQKTGSIKKLTQTKAYCPFCVFSHSWIKVAFKKAASSLPQVGSCLVPNFIHFLISIWKSQNILLEPFFILRLNQKPKQYNSECKKDAAWHQLMPTINIRCQSTTISTVNSSYKWMFQSLIYIFKSTLFPLLKDTKMRMHLSPVPFIHIWPQLGSSPIYTLMAANPAMPILC